jgi:hypothetical protein
MLRQVSGFQLAASLTSSLVWPAVLTLLLVFAWRKRSAITELLDSRVKGPGRPLRRLKAGPVEIEWEQLIESTANQVADTSTQVEATGTVSQELSPIADAVPAAAVLEAFARVERRLREITSDLDAPLYGRKVPTIRTMATQAYKNKIISEDILGAISNLSRLRNEAAHRVGEAEISSGQAREYLELVDLVLQAIDAPRSIK